jgi:catechol 2,3-dioxygenase-like lactoylglutathione lyase family enzyme
MARFPLPHSYIGFQPAKTGGKVDYPGRATGIHHIALWARSRREIDTFYRDFLLKNAVPVSDSPAEYAVYAPGYYAVFFDDPINGIHWELAYTPRLPTPAALLRWIRALRAAAAEHPEWTRSIARQAMRRLPARNRADADM